MRLTGICEIVTDGVQFLGRRSQEGQNEPQAWGARSRILSSLYRHGDLEAPMSGARPSVTLDPGYFVHKLDQALQVQLASLRNALYSLQDGSYAERARMPTTSGVISFQLAIPEDLSEIEQDELRKTYLALIRSFSDFVDTLLGIRKLLAMPHTVTRPLHGSQEVDAYLLEEISKRSQKVGKDGHLSAHEKAKMLATLPPFLQEAVDGYFDIRAALEHHKGVAQTDLSLCTHRLEMLVDEEPIPELPFEVDAGQVISVRAREVTRIILKGHRVTHSESELEDVARTITLSIAPELAKGVSSTKF